jgi:copper transport protein
LLLLAKVALVVPLLALGAYNNRRSVPRLRQQLASALERRRFLRAAGAELALMTAVVAVTAVLVAEPPARAEVAPKGPFATVTALGSLELNLVVDPARAGANAIHLYLSDSAGRPAEVAEARVSAVLASKRIGPLRFRAHRIAPGHFSVHGAQLALAGDWQLGVEVRRGEFESLTKSVSVPIRKES